MMRPIARNMTQLYVQNEIQDNKSDGDQAINQIQNSISESVEELAMSRSLYQSKNKKLGSENTQDLGQLLRGEAGTQEALNQILGNDQITQESIEQVMSQLKTDVGRYQLLRYLLKNANISAAVYQFIFEELEKLKKKRKKITSLDNIDKETVELHEKESISALQLQELFLSFLEYQGHISPYYDDVYKSSKKKYSKIIKFISKMLNYEIYALTTKDDLDAFIYMNEKRKELNMMDDVYSFLENEGSFDDLEFVNSLLMNVEVEKFCDQLSVEQASKIVTLFNRVPQALFFSPEDKEEVLSIMKNNITYRFKRQWI